MCPARRIYIGLQGRGFSSLSLEGVDFVGRMSVALSAESKAFMRRNTQAIAPYGLANPQGDYSEEEMAQMAGGTPIVREGVKVGRNDACPCGSGKKYKQCHGALS